MKLMHIASGVNVTNDFFFGDDEISPLPFDYDNLNNVDPNNEWMLPNEAFQPRRDIVYRSTTPPEDFSANNSQKEQSNQQDEEEIRVNTNDLEHVMASSLRICESELELPPPPPDFTPLVIDVLQYYANLGDVQDNFIDEAVVEHWFMSYIDILHRLRLWNTATEIIQHASIQNRYQHSTSCEAQCGNCGQSISYGKKFCKKCGSIPSRCAVCHCAVQGLFVWCQGCSHGGHLMHLFEWFSENTVCPTGCGHECEFTGYTSMPGRPSRSSLREDLNESRISFDKKNKFTDNSLVLILEKNIYPVLLNKILFTDLVIFVLSKTFSRLSNRKTFSIYTNFYLLFLFSQLLHSF
ncbi:WD repeat-containing protein 24 [Armadillidium vulgare]|nr:WD repeat-containing protein 24 [Armadillidium vulgare]